MNITEEGYIHFNTTPSGGSHTERFRITSGGDVGIGTTNPDKKLEVFGGGIKIDNRNESGSGNAHISMRSGPSGGSRLEIYNTDHTDDNGDWIFKTNSNEEIGFKIASNDVMHLRANRHVGIGTTFASRRLHIQDYNSHGPLRLETSGNGNKCGIEFYRETSAGVGKGGAAIWVESDTSASAGKLRFGTASNAGIQSIDTHMLIDQYGHVGIGTDDVDATLTVHADAANQTAFAVHADMGSNNNRTFNLKTPATDSNSQPFVIQTANALTVQIDTTERFRINDNGRVGINTDCSGADGLFQVFGSGVLARFGNSISSEYECITIRNNTAGYPGISQDSSGDTLDLKSLGSAQVTIDSNNNDTTKYFRVMANGEGDAGTELFRVQEDGKVGINQTTWTNKDHIFEVAQSTQDKEIARFTNLGGVSGSVAGKGFIGLSVFDGSTYPHASIGVEEASAATYQGNLTFSTRASNSDIAPTEWMRIEPNGNIGIGTVNPNKQVHIEAATPWLRLEDATASSKRLDLWVENSDGYIGANQSAQDLHLQTTGTTRIYIKSDGKVGIGTEYPSTLLHIRDLDAASPKLITLQSSTARNNYIGINGADNLEIAADEDGEGGDSSIRFRVDGTERMRIDDDRILLHDAISKGPLETFGSAGLQMALTGGASIILGRNDTSVSTDNNIGGIYFNVNDNASGDTTWNNCARISCTADGTHSDGDYPSRLTFHTTNDASGTLRERMRIHRDGDIGINLDSNPGTNAVFQVSSHGIVTKYGNDDESQYLVLIDSHHGGSDALTANRTKSGIRLDMEYNGTGTKSNTSGNRNQLYGMHCTVNSTEDTYVQHAGYFFSEANTDTQAASTTVSGVYGYGRNYSEGGTNRNSTIYGGYFLGYRGGDINGGHLYGVYSRAHVTTDGSAATGTRGDMTGVYSEVEVDKDTVTNAYGFRTIFDLDNNSGSGHQAPTITNSYMYHGNYSLAAGTTITNKRGIWLVGCDESSIAGDLAVGGNVTANGSKPFRISHPLVGLSTTKDLVHTAIEGPQVDLIYRGKISLVAGISTVNLDTKSGMTEGTFVALNRDVQCFTTNETGWTNVKGSVTGNQLTIIAQDNTCTDTISWMVVGERQDDAIKASTLTDSDGKLILEPDQKPVEEPVEYECEDNIHNPDPAANPGDD